MMRDTAGTTPVTDQAIHTDEQGESPIEITPPLWKDNMSDEERTRTEQLYEDWVENGPVERELLDKVLNSIVEVTPELEEQVLAQQLAYLEELNLTPENAVIITAGGRSGRAIGELLNGKGWAVSSRRINGEHTLSEFLDENPMTDKTVIFWEDFALSGRQLHQMASAFYFLDEERQKTEFEDTVTILNGATNKGIGKILSSKYYVGFRIPTVGEVLTAEELARFKEQLSKLPDSISAYYDHIETKALYVVHDKVADDWSFPVVFTEYGGGSNWVFTRDRQ